MPLLPYRHHQPPATTTAKLFQVSVKKKYCQLPPNTGNANKLPLKSMSVFLSVGLSLANVYIRVSSVAISMRNSKETHPSQQPRP